MTWRLVLEQDPKAGDWAVWCPELPGHVSAGSSEDEAVKNIRVAMNLYLEPLKLEPGAVDKQIAV